MGKMSHAVWSSALGYSITQVIIENTGLLRALNSRPQPVSVQLCLGGERALEGSIRLSKIQMLGRDELGALPNPITGGLGHQDDIFQEGEAARVKRIAMSPTMKG